MGRAERTGDALVRWAADAGQASSLVLGLDARAGGSALSREFLQTGDALLDFWFDDERLKASLAWFGAQSGPPMSEPGTASMAGFAALMHTLPPGRAVGGSGALSAALIARLRADGGELHTGDAVTSLRRSGSGWQVATESGRTLRADTVIAGSHILSTLDLLRAGDFDAAALDDWQRRIRVGPGIGMVVRLATDRLPEYPGASPPNPPVVCSFSSQIVDSSDWPTAPRWPVRCRHVRWCSP